MVLVYFADRPIRALPQRSQVHAPARESAVTSFGGKPSREGLLGSIRAGVALTKTAPMSKVYLFYLHSSYL